MNKKLPDDEPPSILEIANRELAEQRLSRYAPAISQFVIEVFTSDDPDKRFEVLARAYISCRGKDVRSDCITELAWAFGAEKKRPALKKLLRLKGIVGESD